MDTNLLFILANLSYLVGTIFLTKRVIKNRNTLNDFDFYGSSINFVGMMIMAYVFFELKSYVAMIVSIPTMTFWAIVAIYSFKRKRENESTKTMHRRK